MKWAVIAITLAATWLCVARADVTGGGDNTTKTYSVAALSPLTIFQGDLVAWYKCDTGVTTNSLGNKVLTWADQSGNGHNLTNTQGALMLSPTNGITASKCGITAYDNGVGQLLQSATFTINSMKLSMFAVISFSTCLNSSSSYFDYSDGVFFFHSDPNSFRISGPGGGTPNPTWTQGIYSANLSTSIVQNTVYRLGVVNNGSEVVSFYNNMFVNDGTGDGNDPYIYKQNSGYNLVGTGNEIFEIGGGSNFGAALPCGFTLAELLMTRSIAATPQRLSLDKYFKTKWGL